MKAIIHFASKVVACIATALILMAFIVLGFVAMVIENLAMVDSTSRERNRWR